MCDLYSEIVVLPTLYIPPVDGCDLRKRKINRFSVVGYRNLGFLSNSLSRTFPENFADNKSAWQFMAPCATTYWQLLKESFSHIFCNTLIFLQFFGGLRYDWLCVQVAHLCRIDIFTFYDFSNENFTELLLRRIMTHSPCVDGVVVIAISLFPDVPGLIPERG